MGAELLRRKGRAEWALAKAVAAEQRPLADVTRDYGVSRHFVYRARKALECWAGWPEEALEEAGLERAFQAARLAERVGRVKAWERLRTCPAAVLRELARNPYVEPRLALPAPPRSLHERWSEEWAEWSHLWRADAGHDLSHDRFLETVLELLRAIPREQKLGLLRSLWEEGPREAEGEQGRPAGGAG